MKACPICGTRFEHKRRVYCCDTCSEIGYRLRIEAAHKRRSDEAAARRERKPSSINDVARAAHEAGMTYGKYVLEVMHNGNSRQR